MYKYIYTINTFFFQLLLGLGMTSRLIEPSLSHLLSRWIWGQSAVLAYKELQLPANLMHQNPFLQWHELQLTENESPQFLAFYDLQGGCRRTILPRLSCGKEMVWILWVGCGRSVWAMPEIICCTSKNTDNPHNQKAEVIMVSCVGNISYITKLAWWLDIFWQSVASSVAEWL